LLGSRGQIVECSLVDVAFNLLPGNAGLIALAVIFLCLTVVVPLVLMLMLLALWCVPLTSLAQNRLHDACYILDAVASLDVFVVTLAVGHFQFDRLAKKLLLKGNVAVFCGLVQEALGVGCFDVGIEFDGGFAVLSLAGLTALVVPKLANRACSAAIRKRDQALPSVNKDTNLRSEQDAASRDVARPKLLGTVASVQGKPITKQDLGMQGRATERGSVAEVREAIRNATEQATVV